MEREKTTLIYKDDETGEEVYARSLRFGDVLELLKVVREVSTNINSQQAGEIYEEVKDKDANETKQDEGLQQKMYQTLLDGVINSTDSVLEFLVTLTNLDDVEQLKNSPPAVASNLINNLIASKELQDFLHSVPQLQENITNLMKQLRPAKQGNKQKKG